MSGMNGYLLNGFYVIITLGVGVHKHHRTAPTPLETLDIKRQCIVQPGLLAEQEDSKHYESNRSIGQTRRERANSMGRPERTWNQVGGTTSIWLPIGLFGAVAAAPVLLALLFRRAQPSRISLSRSLILKGLTMKPSIPALIAR